MKLFITGDSHASTLASGRSLLTAEQQPAGVELAVRTLGNGYYFTQPFFEVDDGAIRFTRADYAEALRALTGEDRIAPRDDAVFGFCMGFHAARIYRQPQWREFAPASLGDAVQGIKLSAGVLDAIIDEEQHRIVGFLQAAQRLGVRCMAIAAPPPLRSHRCIAEGTSPAMVLELDRAYRARATARLGPTKLPIVTPPDRAYAADGFLLPLFRQGMPDIDEHHGNAAYGHAMLNRILRRVGQLGWV